MSCKSLNTILHLFSKHCICLLLMHTHACSTIICINKACICMQLSMVSCIVFVTNLLCTCIGCADMECFAIMPLNTQFTQMHTCPCVKMEKDILHISEFSIWMCSESELWLKNLHYVLHVSIYTKFKTECDIKKLTLLILLVVKGFSGGFLKSFSWSKTGLGHLLLFDFH